MPDNSGMNPDTHSCHVALPYKNCYAKAPQIYVIRTRITLVHSYVIITFLI
jgi:hypothetical protein